MNIRISTSRIKQAKQLKYILLVDFITEFPDEASCKQKFKEYRDQVGVVCAKSDGKKHY